MTFIIGVACFVLGFSAGSWIRSWAFDRLDWRCVRWSAECFGYRPVPLGTRVYRGDKVIMGLMVETSEWPDEGVVLGEDQL